MKLKYLLIFLLFFLSLGLFAQFTDPDKDPDPDNHPAVPLDGGASLLLVAGAIYGGRKLLKRKKD